MRARGDETGDVRDVRQHERTDFVGDLAHALEVDDARVGARSDGNHLRPMLTSHLRELIVINTLVLLAHAVMDDLEELAGEIGLVAVSQMPAVAEIHRQQFVTRLEHGEVHRHVRA